MNSCMAEFSVKFTSLDNTQAQHQGENIKPEKTVVLGKEDRLTSTHRAKTLPYCFNPCVQIVLTTYTIKKETEDHFGRVHLASELLEIAGKAFSRPGCFGK